MARWLPLLSMVLLCPQPGFALDSSPVLTLDAAFQRALRQHPSLQQAAARVESAEAQVGVAGNGWLPSASIEFQHQEVTGNRPPRVGTTSAAFNASRRPTSYELNGYWSGQAQTKWTYFDFGRTTATIEAARHGVEAAQADVQTVRTQVWWNVASAYLAAYAAESGLHAFQLAVQQQTRTRDVTQQRVQARVRNELDLLKAEADLAAAQGDLLRAEEAARSARVNLAAQMGDTRITKAALQPPNFQAPELTGELDDDAQLDALVQIAVQNRPEYAALRFRMAAQEAAVKAAQRVMRPSLYVSAQGSTGGLALDGMFYNFQLAAGVSIPLATVWTQAPVIADARAQLRGLRANQDAQVLTLRSNLNLAVATLLQARKRINPAAAQVKFAEAAREAAQQRYDAGVGLQIELADAQTAVLKAQLVRVQVDLDIAQATAQLVWSVGKVQ